MCEWTQLGCQEEDCEVVIGYEALRWPGKLPADMVKEPCSDDGTDEACEKSEQLVNAELGRCC